MCVSWRGFHEKILGGKNPLQNLHAPVVITLLTLSGCVCPGEGSMIMPNTQGLPQRDFECNQTDGCRHYGPCLVRLQRDSVGSMGRARVVQLLHLQKRQTQKLQQQKFMGFP